MCVLSSRSYLAIGNQPGFFGIVCNAQKEGAYLDTQMIFLMLFVGQIGLDSFQQHVSLQYMTSAWPEKGTSTYHHHCPQHTIQDRWMDGCMDG